jgi:hypothetical protein
MSGAGGSFAMTNTRLTFVDQLSGVVPQSALVGDGTYRPIDYRTSDLFFPPAPAGPYGKTLNLFHGTNPNGTWSLYVQDDQAADSGVITGGWILSIATGCTSISGIPAQTTLENTTLAIPFAVGVASNLVVTAVSTNDNPRGLVENLTLSGTGTQRVLTILPAPNMPSSATNVDGTSTIILTFVSDGLTNSMSFPLTVAYVNQPPIIGGLIDQTTPANVPLTVNFNLSDVDTPTSNLVVFATVSDALLGSVKVTGNGGDRILTYIPTGTFGTNLVSVTVSDGPNTITNSLLVMLTADQVPIISSIGDLTTNEASATFTIAVDFTVQTWSTNASNLEVSASADNSTLVPSVALFSNSNDYTASITIAPHANGTSTIYVFARDEYGIGTTNFKLTVLGLVRAPALSISRAGDALNISLSGGLPNSGWTLQNSGDLQTWANLTNATANASGVAGFDVPIGSSPTPQFYRVLGQ